MNTCPITAKANTRVVWHPGRSFVLSFAGIVLMALLAGCGSTRPIKYYQVNYPMKSANPSPEAIDSTLLVRLFETSHLYLDDKIVYGYDSPEMGTYEYQRWAQPPVEILQEALVRGLRASGTFKAVYTLRADPGGRFVLAGQLYDFKEVDSSTVVARLAFEARLRDRKSGTTVWDYSYSHDEPATEKTVTAVVVAMDKNLERAVAELQAGLQEYFKQHPLK